MITGGFQAFSLAEFPGKISAVIFTRGCNFRCPYCHNPELVDPGQYAPLLDEGKIAQFLLSRVGQLNAVSITGGEPTLQPDLLDSIGEIKAMGFSVSLETNGSNPAALCRILRSGLVDHVAMDIKAPLVDYSRVVRSAVSPTEIGRSLGMLMSGGVPYEIRTTFHEILLSIRDIHSIGESVRGCASFVLQRLRPGVTLDPRFAAISPPSEERVQNACSLLTGMGIPCTVR